MEPQIRLTEFEPLEAAASREWLEPNGLGGWASGAVPGCNTRRYHGLLVAALRPPTHRFVLWARNEETVESPTGAFPLSTNFYPGAVHPDGYRHLAEFRLLPWPTFVFRCGGAAVARELWMEHGRNTTCLLYRNVGAAPVTLRLRPLLAFREYHTLARENPAVDFRVRTATGCVAVRPYAGLPELRFYHSGGEVEPSALWYYRHEYPRERERGLDFQEDLFSAFTLTFRLAPGERAWLAGTIETAPVSVEAVERVERARRSLPRRYPDPRADLLAWTSRAFVVRREPEGKTILAGYPWFTDWGRDAMISLPGLLLRRAGPDLESARAVLVAFAAHVSEGMIPNRFPDLGEAPEYNTVDASLWFVRAVARYVEVSGDETALRETLFPAVEEILQRYARGTRFGIRMEPDGLLAAGGPETQLTWMDAKIGAHVVTPRHGKAVEVNALWYDALRCGETLARRLGRPAEPYASWAERCRANFSAAFWNPATGALYDVLTPEGPDPSLRPNQMFALSLRPELLPRPQAEAVFRSVEAQLWTPYGLRSLAPSDPRYRGRYEGGVWERDTAYHQGTVWGWLIGPYIDALVTLRGLTPAVRREVRARLEPFFEHLEAAGLGSISEIFDGDPPHTPRGCIAQAWSAAEVLRVYDAYVAEPAAVAMGEGPE